MLQKQITRQSGREKLNERHKHPQYSARDWERHRSDIKKFYIDQDLSLEDVMEKMSTIYMFRPSYVHWNVL